MKKIWYFVIGIFILLILGGVILATIEKDINYFLSCISVGVSILIVYCSWKQNRIQQNNAKIQLFEKRYSVFQSVLDTVTVIKRDNWDRYILFSENDINKQMLLIEENLYKSVQLSICLFDNDLHSKLVLVNNAFCEVSEAYKNMITNSLKNLDTKSKDDFVSAISGHIISLNGFNSKEYESDLKTKFPHIYINLTEFSKECEKYLNFINKCGIIKDFGKYIIVNELDR